GDEDLHRTAGEAAADLADAGREDRGAAVGLVVAVDRRDHGVAQAHAGHGLRHPPRLRRVRWKAGQAGLHRAEPAGPGADVAQDHEGRGPAVPALPHVGAARLLADRMEAQVAHQAAQPVVALAHGSAGLDPGRPRQHGKGQAQPLLLLLLVIVVVLILVVPAFLVGDARGVRVVGPALFLVALEVVVVIVLVVVQPKGALSVHVAS